MFFRTNPSFLHILVYIIPFFKNKIAFPCHPQTHENNGFYFSIGFIVGICVPASSSCFITARFAIKSPFSCSFFNLFDSIECPPAPFGVGQKL